MEKEEIKLTCHCGKTYDNYKEYFACWASHLDKGIPQDIHAIPSDHKRATNYYHRHPAAIEEGLRILAKEISIFHGRIDLIGIDRKNNLVIIDVTTGHDWKRKVNQLKRYKRNVEWIGRNVFGLPKTLSIRLLIVRPNAYVKDVTPPPCDVLPQSFPKSLSPRYPTARDVRRRQE